MEDWLEKHKNTIIFTYGSLFAIAILCEFMIHPFEEIKVKHQRHSQVLSALEDLRKEARDNAYENKREIGWIREKLDEEMDYLDFWEVKMKEINLL